MARAGSGRRPPRARRALVWVLGIAAVVALAGAGMGYVIGERDEAAESSAAPTTTGGDRFTVEADEATLEFGQRGDDATLDFDGEEEGSYTFDLDGDGAVAEGEGGRFELTGAVPPGWPEAFPVPPDATVLRGSVVDGGAVTQQSATYQTPLAAAEVLGFYERALAGADPLVDRADETPEAYSATVSFEGPWTGFLTIGRAGGLTVVGVQLLTEN